MEIREKLAFSETVGSILWFFMDAAWMFEISFLAKVLITPTVLVNLSGFRYTERKLTGFFVTVAMNAWLIMNIFWMVSDLNKVDSLLIVARVMFIVGIGFLIAAIAKTGLDYQLLLEMLSRFRRLRIHR